MTKKALRGKTTTRKYLAAVAGNLLDLTKSLQSLHGIPKTLMRIAANLVSHNKALMPDAHLTDCGAPAPPDPPISRRFSS